MLGHPCRQRRAESIQSVGPRALSAGKRSALSYLVGRACRWSPGCAADQSLRTDPCLWARAVKVLCALNGFVRSRNRPRFGECALNGFERSDPFKAHGGKRGRMCRHTNPAKPHMWPRPTADGGKRIHLALRTPGPTPSPTPSPSSSPGLSPGPSPHVCIHIRPPPRPGSDTHSFVRLRPGPGSGPCVASGGSCVWLHIWPAIRGRMGIFG